MGPRFRVERVPVFALPFDGAPIENIRRHSAAPASGAARLSADHALGLKTAVCGIAGIVNESSPPGAKEIGAMIADITYRGPDANGQVCLDSDGVALGHRRLSILDLSDAGSQPMATGDGRFWLVFNGEIYNYLEIRKDLEALGRVFRSHSDTEVLLLAYAQWGSACLERFVGMFAFAIWDRQRRELFAARDRLGIKPF